VVESYDHGIEANKGASQRKTKTATATATATATSRDLVAAPGANQCPQ
jgi:hypothetical protein